MRGNLACALKVRRERPLQEGIDTLLQSRRECESRGSFAASSLPTAQHNAMPEPRRKSFDFREHRASVDAEIVQLEENLVLLLVWNRPLHEMLDVKLLILKLLAGQLVNRYPWV